ncbi:MAG: tyrosine-type recombinase/integrase, partial [Acidimicrobiales bacterium]
VHTLQWARGAWVMAETKTQRSRRTLPLPGLGAAALDRQRAQQAAERLRVGSRWADSWGLIFTTPTGQPRLGTAVTRHFQRQCAGLGLPPMRFHDLRHTAATFLAGAGLPARDVQEHLGHSSVVTTLGIYTHVVAEAGRVVADTLDAILAPPAAGPP